MVASDGSEQSCALCAGAKRRAMREQKLIGHEKDGGLGRTRTVTL